MRVIYLSDNDVLEKLAICDLLDDALEAFDADRSDVLVLRTLKHRIGIGSPRPKTVGRLGEAAATRLVQFLATVNEVQSYSETDHDLLESLDEGVEIDPGEIILLSATDSISDYLLLTGDKRCLRAVASHPACAHIAARIQRRVVCFEQIVRRIIDRKGFVAVRSKVVPVLNCDAALRAAFGSGEISTEENVCACLDSYIAEIRRFPVDLLMAGY